MTHAARIEVYDREGKRLKWKEGNFYALRFSLDLRRDSERSQFVQDFVTSIDLETLHSEAYLIRAEWSTLQSGIRKDLRYCLVFQVMRRAKEIRLI